MFKKFSIILYSHYKFLLSANEVAERYCFNTCLSVILFTGGDVSQHALGQTPPGRPPPLWADTPLPGGHCCGRYASYWNAFLYFMILSRYSEHLVSSPIDNWTQLLFERILVVTFLLTIVYY